MVSRRGGRTPPEVAYFEKAFCAFLTNLREERAVMAITGAATAMSKENQSETVKMTLYIEKPVVKRFKKLAIDKEMDYSKLATLALREFVENQPETDSR
jgi:hypothetical protein